MGGFDQIQILSDCGTPLTVLAWQSLEGYSGLWACPTGTGLPLSQEAVLKASTAGFVNTGCLFVDGVQISPAGDNFGAWAYT